MTSRKSSKLQSDDEKERLRLATLAALELLDSRPEREFDVVVDLARFMLHCKIAQITLIDADRQWFKASCGSAASETPREHSLCSRAIELDEPLVVPDATADARFRSNPLVTGPPFIRFYAGIPIRAKIHFGATETVAIGTLCVIDDSPRQIGVNGLKVLRDLAHVVEALIDARSASLHASRLAAERQTHIHRLEREQRQFGQAERMANIGSWRLDLATRRVAWSRQVFAIHELPVGEAPHDDTAMSFYAPPARAILSAAVARAIEYGEAYDVELDLVTAKGNERRVRNMGELETVDGKPVALIGVCQDVTTRHHLEQSLRRIASTDDLTQLPNRAKFNQVLDDAIAASVEHNDTLALLLIDLDGFKLVNDRCGHFAGDDLLRLVSTRLRAAYLSRCFVARLGGDEFVLVVSAAEDLADLDAIVARLLGDLRHTVGHTGGTVHVSGTIGISWLDETMRSRRELLHRADLALYAAKQEQRGSARVFGRDGGPSTFPKRACALPLR